MATREQQLEAATISDDDFKPYIAKLKLKGQDAILATASPAESMGALLLELRTAAQLIQTDLTALIGLSATWDGPISYWENNKRDIASNRLGELLDQLHPSLADAMKFALLVRPDLLPEEPKAREAAEKWLEATMQLAIAAREDKTIPPERAKAMASYQWEKLSYPALDKFWIATQPKEKRAGLLLRDLRESKSIVLTAMAKEIGVDKMTLSDWERSVYSINREKIGDILQHLKCDAHHAGKLLLMVNPQILPAGEESQKRVAKALRGIIAKAIEYGETTDIPAEEADRKAAAEWKKLSYPVLIDAWMNEQPEKNRAGLLLKYHRTAKGIEQKALAEALEIEQATISGWERGSTLIPPAKLQPIISLLDISPEDAQQFVVYATSHRFPQDPYLRSQAIDWTLNQLANNNWDNLIYPALDPRWLDIQPLHKRAGAMLNDLLLRGVDGKEVMKKDIQSDLELSRDKLVSHWASGIEAIPTARAEQICAVLHLDGAMKDRFLAEVEKSREPIRAHNAIKKATSVKGAEVPANDHPELSKSGESRGR